MNMQPAQSALIVRWTERCARQAATTCSGDRDRARLRLLTGNARGYGRDRRHRAAASPVPCAPPSPTARGRRILGEDSAQPPAAKTGCPLPGGSLPRVAPESRGERQRRAPGHETGDTPGARAGRTRGAREGAREGPGRKLRRGSRASCAAHDAESSPRGCEGRIQTPRPASLTVATSLGGAARGRGNMVPLRQVSTLTCVHQGRRGTAVLAAPPRRSPALGEPLRGSSGRRCSGPPL